jgi:hypothetical protein
MNRARHLPWRLATATTLLATVITVLIPSAAAAQTSPIKADFNGRPIPASEVVKYHCSALDYPVIHCYSSQTARDAADARLTMPRAANQASSPAVPTATGYVIAYVDVSYAGASISLSTNYANLTSIGWNDRISSLKSIGNGSGDFYQNAYYVGWIYGFCCNQAIWYVGDFYNDQFSSLQFN